MHKTTNLFLSSTRSHTKNILNNSTPQNVNIIHCRAYAKLVQPNHSPVLLAADASLWFPAFPKPSLKNSTAAASSPADPKKARVNFSTRTKPTALHRGGRSSDYGMTHHCLRPAATSVIHSFTHSHLDNASIHTPLPDVSPSFIANPDGNTEKPQRPCHLSSHRHPYCPDLPHQKVYSASCPAVSSWFHPTC